MLYNQGPLSNNFTTLDSQKLRLEYARACFLAVQQDALSEAINSRRSNTIITGTDETITTETAKCNNTSMTDEATPAKPGPVKKGKAKATAGDSDTIMTGTNDLYAFSTRCRPSKDATFHDECRFVQAFLSAFALGYC
ncbi:hypothetical protein ACMFMG_008128 [Clarireedia jacksonii]